MSTKPLNIFIGYDKAETVAYHVCAHSIMMNSSVPVSITPLIYDQLPINREKDPLQSTDFTYTRFLVPYLMGYEGVGLFMDCDMLVDCDIAELFALNDPTKAVSVVKHDYIPKTKVKFLNNVQSLYPRKNWSSLMLYNAGHDDCKKLTTEVVSRETGKYLHRFEWTEAIGELDVMYNHLVGEYNNDTEAKIYHYTLGTPCFREVRCCDHSHEWHKAQAEMNSHAN